MVSGGKNWRPSLAGRIFEGAPEDGAVIYFRNTIGGDAPGLCLVDQGRLRYDFSAGDERVRRIMSFGVHLWQIYRR